MSDNSDGIQRRTFLAASALAGTAVLSTSATASVGNHPLKVGDRVGGWTVTSMASNHAGAVVATLGAGEGDALRVMLTRAEASANPMATTGSVDLVLLNAGGGKQPTPDAHVRAVQSLAQRLRGVENALPGASSMLTATERQRRFRPIDHEQA